MLKVPAEKPTILCVDDEPLVLDGIRDRLRRSFDVRTATSGAEGLKLLRADPRGYAVVISDMRMPEMPGSTFLREAKRLAPLSVRMLLTGHSDADAAAKAVNDGGIFRYLTKPMERDALLQACAAALTQHRIQTAERDLLEQTLRGAVKALTDVLALAAPAVFGRGARLKTLVGELAAEAGRDGAWEVEVAAMLAQIGAITLPSETAEKLYAGAPLTPAEEAMVARVPALSQDILASIPRLEGVLQILANQGRSFDQDDADGAVPIGARILRVSTDYLALRSQGVPAALALDTLRGRDRGLRSRAGRSARPLRRRPRAVDGGGRGRPARSADRHAARAGRAQHDGAAADRRGLPGHPRADRAAAQLPRRLRRRAAAGHSGARMTVQGRSELAIAREELRQSESRLRLLLANIPGAVYRRLFDDEMTMLLVSDRVEALTGFPAADLIGSARVSFASVVHPEDRERIAREVLEAVAEDRHYGLAYRVVRADGTEAWVGDRGQAVSDEDGGPLSLYGMLSDIDQRKKLEADHARMEVELQMSHKLESVGQLAAGIAHEINTPMQYVGDGVEFLKESIADLERLLDVYRAALAPLTADPAHGDLRERLLLAEAAADIEYLRERLPAACERTLEGIERVTSIVRAMKEFAHPQSEQAPGTSTARWPRRSPSPATSTATSPSSRPISATCR